MPTYRGELGIQIGPGETENLAQFWASNKMLISYRPEICIQAAQRGSPTRYRSKSLLAY